jgi:prepilin-type N-terminal cleavage/methylation domain-containing protein
MRRTGFTLIELLVVILIIVALAGLLIPMIGYARNAAKAAKCDAQMAGIKAAISRYVDTNGTIPDKELGGGSDAYANTFKNGANYKTADQLTSSDWMTIAQTLLAQLQTVGRDDFRDLAALRDPFTGGASATNVFRYRPAKFYPLLDVNGSPKPKFIDGDGTLDGVTAPPNPDSYQLWSTGPDTKDQFGERVNGRKSDDITNWKQP